MSIQIIGIRDNPEYLEKGIDYFASRWGIDRRIYADSISHCITTCNPLPRWYLMLKDDEITGSYGLISNDFISRQDLYPWLCALFIEKDQRGRQLGLKLLEHGRVEAGKLGFLNCISVPIMTVIMKSMGGSISQMASTHGEKNQRYMKYPACRLEITLGCWLFCQHPKAPYILISPCFLRSSMISRTRF